MTGYQELVTDPSYAEQIVCFTAPMVGNYGVADERCESGASHARGVVMREARGPEWTDWLAQHGVVALTGVDTRSLVLHLRDRRLDARRARDAARSTSRRRSRRPRAAVDGRALARRRCLDAGAVPLLRRRRAGVAVVDYGCKRSILRPARRRRRVRHRLPARRRRGHAGRARRRRCSRTAPATPSRSRTRSRPSRARSAACRCSGSASATSCSRSRPGSRRSSCRSATAARTTRSSTGARAACS